MAEMYVSFSVNLYSEIKEGKANIFFITIKNYHILFYLKNTIINKKASHVPECTIWIYIILFGKFTLNKDKKTNHFSKTEF
jgi:hypothetical protein